MKFTKTIALALAAGVVASSAFAQEEEGGFQLGAYAGTVLKNGYLSNGYVFYDDTVLQSYAGVTAGDDDIGTFDLNIWNSWGIGSSHDRTNYGSCDASEIDYELDYSKSYEDFDFMLGVAAWVYPDTDDSFDEWVGKVAVGYNGFVVRPELNARFGLEGQQGCYGQFKLSKSFDIDEDAGLSAKVYGLIGAASKSYRQGKGVDKNGLVDTEFGATLSWEFCDNASVCAGVQYAVIIDDDLRDAIDSGDAFMASGDKENFMYFVGADIWF